MDFEALIAVGIATLVLGAPLFWLSRRWLRSAIGAKAKRNSPHMTKVGLLVAVVLVVLLLGGFAAGHLAPETAFGQLMKQPLGRLAYALTLGFLSIPLQQWLKTRGMDLYSTSAEDRQPEQGNRKP